MMNQTLNPPGAAISCRPAIRVAAEHRGWKPDSPPMPQNKSRLKSILNNLFTEQNSAKLYNREGIYQKMFIKSIVNHVKNSALNNSILRSA
jgi:hypothetical protein